MPQAQSGEQGSAVTGARGTFRSAKPRTVGSLVHDFKGNTWRVVTEPVLVSGFNGSSWYEFHVEREPKRNPPSGFIPCKAVKITRNGGKVEVRIRK
jgi:hypothetical protein